MEMSIEEMAAKAAMASRMLKAIANESRLMIVCQLYEQELSVGQLLKTVPLSQSALSQHLSVLRHEDIVSTRREAQSVFYTLSSDEVRTIMATIYDIYCKPDS